MSNQTLNLDGQLIESNLLESDLDSDLSPRDATTTDTTTQDPWAESDTLELNSEVTAESELVESTVNEPKNNAELFDDSEIETSSLYSKSTALNSTSTEPLNHETETTPPTGETPEETPEETPLTQTITVGDPEGTQFTFNFAEGTSQEVIDGITQAGENWSAVLEDRVNITIDFTFEASEPGNLGGAIPTYIPLPYSTVSQAMAQDASSANDNTAVANLPEGNAVDLLLNNTAENNGSDTPYLDNNDGLNNATIGLTTANAKALGISIQDIAEANGVSPEEIAAYFSKQYNDYPIDPNAVDAKINMNSDINWDFDPSDGIGADAVDFVGIFTHELGHALGFTSAADDLDGVAVAEVEGINVDQFISENSSAPNVMDLFRFSPESFEQGARDLTTGNIDDKYFSIDGGQTAVAPMALGSNTATNLEDRQQLSHWQDNLNLGIMDPTGSPGELSEIGGNDLLAFDVMGWDLA